MPALIRRDDKYVRDWTLRPDSRFSFSWTKDLEKAAEYSDDFAALVALKVGGKLIPVVKETHTAESLVCRLSRRE